MYTNRLREAVLAAIEKHNMLCPGDRVLCALSGGADSVCLTHVLWALRVQLGIELKAAHFSHGIRPHAAQGERQLCQSLCDRLGLELICGEGDAPAAARRDKMGLEAAARELRYIFLWKTARDWGTQHGMDALAVGRGGIKAAIAHNRGDQAETVLMNLIRGTGLQGIRGIEAKAGRTIRPLLEVPRAVIEGYAAENGLAYATDETNADNAFTRNKVRNQIMPLLREINPKAEANMARTATLAAQDLDYLRNQAKALMADLPAPHQMTTVFDADTLAAAHPAVGGRAVLMAWERFSLLTLSRRHVEAVLALAASPNPSGRINLPFGAVARRAYDKLYIEPGDKVAGWLAADFGASADQIGLGQTVQWAGWSITASREPLAEAWHFDAETVRFPIHIRQRQTGDVVDWGGYHKSVKKLMIERKIPKNIRDIVPILWDNKGVLCVGPYAADRTRARKTPGSHTVSICVTMGAL